eukprot:m.20928 g.20928  ORF g.20928 m.20928 type:complete len:316 (-) comp10338_c0_seq1:78-1025(-)
MRTESASRTIVCHADTSRFIFIWTAYPTKQNYSNYAPVHVSSMDADWCGGPDSEEIISEVVASHGNRDAIRTIRAVLQGNGQGNGQLIRDTLAAHVNTSLLLGTDGDPDCCRRAYEEEGGIAVNTPIAVGPYPDPPQFASGDAGPQNELFPSGEYDEPERGLDALFWPPLLWAARNQDAEMCQLLIDLGADPDFISPAGTSAVLAMLRGACLFTPGTTARAVATLNVVATNNTINYVSPSKQALADAAPEVEYSLHADSLPIIAVCCEPDFDPEGGRKLVQAMLAKGAIAPPQFVSQLTPDWFPQAIIDLLKAQE